VRLQCGTQHDNDANHLYRKASPHTRTVDLVGSWDNFTKPYALERDRVKGKEFWKGCHRIDHITCDGTTALKDNPRTEGLKMGERYWYYVS
jgi:hypothetical protein